MSPLENKTCTENVLHLPVLEVLRRVKSGVPARERGAAAAAAAMLGGPAAGERVLESEADLCHREKEGVASRKAAAQCDAGYPEFESASHQQS